MFSKKAKIEVNMEKMETVLGKGTFCEGVLTASGSIRVDGDFKGEIKTDGDLVVGEDGKVEAKVSARNVYLAGCLNGNLQAEGKLEITVTGKMTGDIVVGDLIIDEGAFFNGSCNMHNNNCKMQIGEEAKPQEYAEQPQNYAEQPPQEEQFNQ